MRVASGGATPYARGVLASASVGVATTSEVGKAASLKASPLRAFTEPRAARSPPVSLRPSDDPATVDRSQKVAAAGVWKDKGSGKEPMMGAAAPQGQAPCAAITNGSNERPTLLLAAGGAAAKGYEGGERRRPARGAKARCGRAPCAANSSGPSSVRAARPPRPMGPRRIPADRRRL